MGQVIIKNDGQSSHNWKQKLRITFSYLSGGEAVFQWVGNNTPPPNQPMGNQQSPHSQVHNQEQSSWWLRSSVIKVTKNSMLNSLLLWCSSKRALFLIFNWWVYPDIICSCVDEIYYTITKFFLLHTLLLERIGWKEQEEYTYSYALRKA